MPYGYSVLSRLKSIQGYDLPEELEEDDEGVIYGLTEIIDEEKL